MEEIERHGLEMTAVVDCRVTQLPRVLGPRYVSRVDGDPRRHVEVHPYSLPEQPGCVKAADGRRLGVSARNEQHDAVTLPVERQGGVDGPGNGLDARGVLRLAARDLLSGKLRRLTENDGYDAEGAVSPDGSRIVFTSLREGNLDLYLVDADGSHGRRLTDRRGYNGGPFFSWDGRAIVFRSAHPETRSELEEFETLLKQSLVRPRRLEIFVMRSDGTGIRQVTRSGAASFAPFMHPNGEQIIFSSNLHDPSGRTFALYLVNVDGSGLERLTHADSFASFPMFSRDGARLVFCGNRNAGAPRELNVFITDWIA